MLFSHGVDSVGLASIERWGAIFRRARRQGALLGVDEFRFPRDFATFVRYHTEIRKLPPRYPLPGRLALSQLDEFLKAAGNRYAVEWEPPGSAECRQRAWERNSPAWCWLSQEP